MIGLITDFAGLAVGLVFLILAVVIVPGRVKWYILTAGLAVLGYEFYTRVKNRQKLENADAKRKELNEKVEGLIDQRKNLENQVNDLNARLETYKQDQVKLEEEKKELEKEGADLSDRGKELSDELIKSKEKSKKVIQDLDNSEAVLALLQDAEHSMQALDKAENKS